MRYSLIGMALYFHTCHDWHKLSIALIVQGFMSYWSDVHTLGYESISHVLDPICASTLTVLIFANIIHAILYKDNFLNPIQRSISVLMFVVGFITRIQASKYLREKNQSQYIFWHTFWHASLTLPSLGILSVAR